MSTMESLPAPQEQLNLERPQLYAVGKASGEVVVATECFLPDVAVPSDEQQLFGD